MPASGVASADLPAFLNSFRNLIIMKIPLLSDAVLASEAGRQAASHATDPLSQTLLVSSQRRFLRCLGNHASNLFQVQPEDGQTDKGSARRLGHMDPQVSAIVLNTLDAFPSWDELAIEGARQDGEGRGTLAGAGFGWKEVEM